MSEFTKVILFIVVMLYIVSPVDLCPGPIDDVIVLLLSVAAFKGGSLIESDD